MNIKSDGFRSLKMDQKVDFEIARDDKERFVAKNVTGPDGTKLEPPTKFSRGGSRGGRRFNSYRGSR